MSKKSCYYFPPRRDHVNNQVRKILITDDESYKTMKLICVENNRGDQILRTICQETVVIIDEFDSLYDP